MNPFDLTRYDIFSDTLKVWSEDVTPDKMIYTTYMGRQILCLANPELFFEFESHERIHHFYFSPSKNDRKTPIHGLSEFEQPFAVQELNKMMTEIDWSYRGISYFLYYINHFNTGFCDPINVQKIFKTNESVMNICKNKLTFENDILSKSKRHIIYYIIGKMWDVANRSTMICAGELSDVFMLDIDTGHEGYSDSYDIFIKLCEDNGVKWTELCTGRSKNNGRHVYFNYQKFYVGEGDKRSLSPTHFCYLRTKDGNIREIGWDIRNSGTGLNALGVFYHENRKEWSAMHFIYPPYQKVGLYDDDFEDSDDIKYVSLTPHMSWLSDECFERGFVHYDARIFQYLFMSREIYEDKDGKYRVKEFTLDECTAFLERRKSEKDKKKIADTKNKINSRGIINKENFDIIRNIFKHFTDTDIKNASGKTWRKYMAAIKNAVYGNKIDEMARDFYWKHCYPFVDADIKKDLSRTVNQRRAAEKLHEMELDEKWSEITCTENQYPTLTGVINTLLKKVKKTDQIKELNDLLKEIRYLCKRNPQDPFEFQERVNALKFETIHTIDELEIRRNQRDMITDILNENGRLYVLDSFEKSKFESLLNLNGTLQDYIRIMKRTMCYVLNDGKSYYIVKTFNEHGKLETKSTLDKDYHNLEMFESKLKRVVVETILVDGKKHKLTLLDIVEKFRDYITFSNIRRDFDQQYFYNGKDVTERYLSLYNFQALSYDCNRKDEDKEEFLCFFVRLICHYCDMDDAEISKQVEIFKNTRVLSNPSVKFNVYWLSNLITDWRNKNGTSLYLYSPPGVGKTKFFEWFEEHVLSDSYCCVTDERQMNEGRFNIGFVGKLFVRIEDITANNVENIIDILKREITNTKLRREGKGVDSTNEKSFNRMLLCSNQPHFMEDRDRRFMYNNARKSDDEEYKRLFRHYFEDQNNKDYARVLYDYLVSLPSKGDQFNFIEELKSINEKPSAKNFNNRVASMSSIQRYVYDLIGSSDNSYFEKIIDGIYRVEVKEFYEHYQKANTNHKLNKANFVKEICNMFGNEKYVIVKPYSRTKRDHFIFENLKNAFEYFFKTRNLMDRFNLLLTANDMEEMLVAEIEQDERTITVRLDKLKAIAMESDQSKRLSMIQSLEDELLWLSK